MRPTRIRDPARVVSTDALCNPPSEDAENHSADHYLPISAQETASVRSQNHIEKLLAINSEKKANTESSITCYNLFLVRR
jgi:hypothetical protein